ncbi:ABC transporter permease [uncultured Mucilaginibacter sp.]|uniref:ABC transporter permease n=1 Tax=uncultured Mucilaginibacter sp. TaxID=797541 RepID=UPI0025F4EFDB|nr:ABC transporter permease [uncultured Mucilaginibacter sp.]
MLKTAWEFIRFDKAKSIGVIVGILISTFLIGQQLGVFFFLTGLMGSLATNVKADIWVVDSKTDDVNQLGKLDIRTLRAVQGLSGVKEAFPILITGASCNYNNGTSGAITLIGVDISKLNTVLDSSKIIAGKPADLQMDGAVSAEFFEKKNIGDNINLGTDFEINGKRAFFALQTKGFRGFGSSISVTTIERARFYSNQSVNSVSAVLVKLLPGANADDVVARINSTISGVRAWPSQALAKSTIEKILGSSGIALSTGTLIVFALIAGFFIIGLTMYSSALDRLKDYGTLKAIGAGNGYIRRLILTQAMFFAIAGFVIGMLLLEGFRMGVAKSGLIFSFSPLVISGMFLTIALIALGGASFALRRISSVEPASVFN